MQRIAELNRRNGVNSPGVLPYNCAESTHFSLGRRLGPDLLGALIEAERASDLHPVPLDRPPRPSRKRRFLLGHLHLLSDARHCRHRNLSSVLREPGLRLKELQTQGEPPASSLPTGDRFQLVQWL